MATKKIAPIIEGVDLAAFAKQKQEVEQKASQAIAQRLELIRTTLEELVTIASISGVTVHVGDIIEEFENRREALDPNTDWSSSSAYC